MYHKVPSKRSWTPTGALTHKIGGGGGHLLGAGNFWCVVITQDIYYVALYMHV